MKPAIVALTVAIWLRFLLTATAMMFYELHHLTGVDWIYWGYSIFKAGGYYFGIYPHQTLVSVAVGVVIFLLLSRVKYRRRSSP